MAPSTAALSPIAFRTFGELLRYLRRRQRLTQFELAAAVGYSTAQISRLEQNLRRPNPSTLQGLFIPALGLQDQPDMAARLLELAQVADQLALPTAAAPDMPSTFFFTDIEGSTQLWERHPEAMRRALARHDAILRHAVEQHRGVVVKSIGDGVHAVFNAASDAGRAMGRARAAPRAHGAAHGRG